MKTIAIAAALLIPPSLACAQQQPMPPTMQMPDMPMPSQQHENHAAATPGNLPETQLLGAVAKRAPMTLEDFESIAEKTNPTLAQSRTLVRRAEQQGRQSALYPNPVVAYDAEHIRGGSYGGGEQGAYLQQNIVLGGKLGLRRSIYQRQAQEYTIGVDEQTYRVRNSVQQAFYKALTAQAAVVVRQHLLMLSLDAVKTSHQLENVGQADQPDVLQAEVEAEQANIDFVRSQREYLEDFQKLATIAGSRQLSVCPLKGDLEHPPAIDPEQQVATIVSASPTVKRAQQEVSVAEARLKAAKREAVPDLQLRAGEWWSGEQTSGTSNAAGPMSFVSAGVALPLWNRNQGNVEAAKAELERAQEDVTRTELSLKNLSEPLAQQYLAAQFEADRYRTDLLPRAQRAYDLYLAKYKQMAAAYPQVLISQRTLFQLQLDYLHALSTVWTTASALENFTLDGALSSPSSEPLNSTINLPNGGSQ